MSCRARGNRKGKVIGGEGAGGGNYGRNADRIKIEINPYVTTVGYAIAKEFKERFRERIAGKSKWGREWNRIRDMAKKNNRKRNPSELEELAEDIHTLDASRMSEKFHGRKTLGEFDIDETETYDDALAVLGDLIELNILCPDNEDAEFTISFDKGNEKPLLCCDAHGGNLEIVGGDQDLELPQDVTEGKKLAIMGEIRSVCYFTDKHHLEGPKSQARGVEYEHQFGEEGGNRPHAVYDTVNCKILIVGGSYTIEETGIAN